MEIRQNVEGKYYPELDGLRLLAILSVIVWHIGLRIGRLIAAQYNIDANTMESIVGNFLPHGEIGVEVFFVLSGFILAKPILSKRSVDFKIDILSFYKRRLQRLYFPYLIVIIISFISLSLVKIDPTDAPRLNHGTQTLSASFLASLFYLNGILFSSAPKINPPLWSIEIEIQFYALLPIILFLFGLIKEKREKFILILTASFSILFIILNIIIFNTQKGSYEHWNLIGYLHLFLMGVFICQLNEMYNFKDSVFWDIGFLISLFALILSGIAYNSSELILSTYARAIMSISSITLVFSLINSKYIKNVLSNNLIALSGSACYSIYLIHAPILQFTMIICKKMLTFSSVYTTVSIFTSLSILIISLSSVFFYVFIERPFMDKHWPTKFANRLKQIRSYLRTSH